ncbi:MAG: hypothetical protein ISR69_13610 [Gammaproteobacteria bacterium]|nr:hypothetical protein [Gammaproteobacteria bacterium]
MKRFIKYIIIVTYLLGMVAYAQSARIFILSADEWAQPRTGEVMASFNSVRNAVDYWQKTYNSSLLIRYPGEDMGELWASELKDWLIALGVPNDYIILRSGLESLDQVQIVVGTKDDLNRL